MLARKGIAFVSWYNPHLLRKLSFCFEAYHKIPNKEDEAITDSVPVSDFSSSLHNLSPFFSDGKFPSNGYNIELVDHDAWRVSSGVSQAWQGREQGAPEASSTGQEETNELIDSNSSNAEDEVDFEDIDNMRIRGNLFYKLEKSSKEFEEYNLEFHRKKSSKKGDGGKENSKKETKKEKKASQSPKTSRVQEVQTTRSVNMPRLPEASVTSVENKKQRTLTLNQLTGPYHEPFCLDIFISKASVRACVVHRVTSKVVAVAHSISKDMKFDFTSTKNKNTCAAVGSLLAQRALADDIHDVIYTPRKGERLEGKLQIVLQSIIDNGINVKVKIKQRKPQKAFQSPMKY
ncbi:uncharacterized protein LOC114728820 [Neltuma alba]|uniref:uncharacterized protein LOC114728820 n=1 Tax=Neltuma alba TaxID=207710 RepID=UPI0010A3C14A|nr:uncharacterized protein LOC114728820 [Prosopis alba]